MAFNPPHFVDQNYPEWVPQFPDRIHPDVADLPLGYFCKRELTERERRLELDAGASSTGGVLGVGEACEDFAVEIRDAVEAHVAALRWWVP